MRPPRDRFLPFAAPMIGEAEIEAVVACLRSGWLTTGPNVKQFESAFADFTGARHALAVNSCTAALHLALEAAGIGPGDEVVTSPMTFTATAAVVEHLGARPVFVDCDPASLSIDAGRIESAITPRTKAILPVHFAGQACDMDTILAVADRHGLPVIEDAAHALPTRHRGRMVGALGKATCFSFYATKNITTGEGGMVTTDDDVFADRMRLMHLHGMSRDAWKRYTAQGSWSYEVLAPGFKYNLTDLAAAMGSQQLRRCHDFHARRLEIARRYDQAFADLEGIETPRVAAPLDHAWHLYVVRVDAVRAGIDRDALIQQLSASNIGVSVHFIPLHVQPYYRDRYGYRPEDFPNALAAYRQIVSLPIYARMTDADIEDVIAAVHDAAGVPQP